MLRKVISGAACFCLFLTSVVFAGSEGFFYKEINLIGGYSDQERWIDKSGMTASSLGFEYYRKFSGDYGDYLTADLQARASYDNTRNSRDAWGLEIHNAWLEYKFSQYTRLKVGHFDPSFGMEPVLDTHGTLFQTLSEQDIGFKKDWGAQLKGLLDRFDYEISLQTGSGMSIRRRDDSYLATLRIGTPQGRNFQSGLSFLSGRTLETEGMHTLPKNRLVSDEAINKKRVGLDAQYLYGAFLFKGELSYGTNDNKEVLGYLSQIDYTVPSLQNLELQIQFKSWLNDIHSASNDDSALTFGASYKLNQTTTLRAAYSRNFGIMQRKPADRFTAQLYFFGA